EPASQKTTFKILYDNNYLYVAVKAHDDQPDKIKKRMSRRDGFEGDMVTICIDSYFDKMSAFSFTLSASGIKGDEMVTLDGDNWDATWDPIWYGSTTVHKQGWDAEFKIPMDQLRFDNRPEQVWGLQVSRYISRLDEWDDWRYVPKTNNGYVSHFALLYGINNIKPRKQNDVMPYVVSKLETYKKEEGNPYADGLDLKPNLGVDGKLGITNNFTLDYTINPDFGQVEADPSEVNLTSFETYLDEKRPFFVEGKNITNFNLTMGNAPYSRDKLFYSRRIGREPQHSVDLEDGQYQLRPENTTILGSLKLTGKTSKGLSVGIIESVTDKEKALIYNQAALDNKERNEPVEPLTNYTVARAEKEIDKGNTKVGGMFTSTNRKLESDNLDFLHKNAYTGGVNFTQFFFNKNYYVAANAVFSHVEGSTNAIKRTQESGVRYMQRPDVDYGYDTANTSLTGTGGSVHLGRDANKGLRFITWLAWRSPQLALNDVGYLNRGDLLTHLTWVGYQVSEPFFIFRQANINVNHWHSWDFEGRQMNHGVDQNSHFQFKNLWWWHYAVLYDWVQKETFALRGGPALDLPAYWNYFTSVNTNYNKKLIINLGINGHTRRMVFQRLCLLVGCNV
ncbi:MAG: carbohydrate binding family 9 domain-containing protein, partial [Bacteroidales bacterium]|nr:carbohydrate binding family 9 domain-containing protein [Bacteroidales bacterium]